jgi:hypothetical protein
MKIRKFDLLMILIIGVILLFSIKSCNDSNSKIAQLNQQISQIKPLIDQNRLYVQEIKSKDSIITQSKIVKKPTRKHYRKAKYKKVVPCPCEWIAIISALQIPCI